MIQVSEMVKKYLEVHLTTKHRKILPKIIEKYELDDHKPFKIDKPLDLMANTKRKLEEYTIDANNRYHCVKCTKSYKNKRHLQRHQKEECIDVEPRFKCDVCLSSFRRKYHLSRHIMNKHK